VNGRRLVLVLAGIVLTCGLPVCSDNTPLVDPPYSGLDISAATDSTVRIEWVSRPGEAGFGCSRHEVFADSFFVQFREAGAVSWRLLGNTESTEWTHDPQGMTGDYSVSIWFGDSLYDDCYSPQSTEPVRTPAALVAELNGAGSAGYGWAGGHWEAHMYSMRDTASAKQADLYLTDFAAGYQGPDYFLASPSLGPGDLGEGVPQADWRESRFAAALADGGTPSPVLEPQAYSDRFAIDGLPMVVCCHTGDAHFAQVRVLDVNTAAGTATVESWYQPIKGLRLVLH